MQSLQLSSRLERPFIKQSSWQDYYPFGWKLPGRNQQGAEGYRYGYQGQFAEEDVETGWNSFELRMWDGRIGRWMTTDPAGQYHSPYLGMGNNWVKMIDPDGSTALDDYRLNEDGSIELIRETADKFDRLFAPTDNDVELNYIVINDQSVLSNLASQFEARNVNRFFSATSNENLTDLFKFVAARSNVEWSMFDASDLSGNRIFGLGTSANEYNTVIPSFFYDDVFNKGYNFNSYTHSHPHEFSYYPSGYNYNTFKPKFPPKGDFQQMILKDQQYGNGANHYIYHPKTKTTIQYNNGSYWKAN